MSILYICCKRVRITKTFSCFVLTFMEVMYHCMLLRFRWMPLHIYWFIFDDNLIDGSVQDCINSIALALELLQCCTKPSIWWQLCDPVVVLYFHKTRKNSILVEINTIRINIPLYQNAIDLQAKYLYVKIIPQLGSLHVSNSPMAIGCNYYLCSPAAWIPMKNPYWNPLVSSQWFFKHGF